MTTPLSTNPIKYVQPIVRQDITEKKKNQKSEHKSKLEFNELFEAIKNDTLTLKLVLDEKSKSLAKIGRQLKKIQKLNDTITNIDIEKKEKILNKKFDRRQDECKKLDARLLTLGIDYNKSKFLIGQIKKKIKKLDVISSGEARIDTYRECIGYLSHLKGPFLDAGMGMLHRSQSEESAKIRDEINFCKSVGRDSIGVEEAMHREQALRTLDGYLAQIVREANLIREAHNQFYPYNQY